MWCSYYVSTCVWHVFLINWWLWWWWWWWWWWHKFPTLKCSKFLKVETARLKCYEIKLFYSELSKCWFVDVERVLAVKPGLRRMSGAGQRQNTSDAHYCQLVCWNTTRTVLLYGNSACSMVDVTVIRSLKMLVWPFSALTLLVGWQEGHPACKQLGVGLLVMMIWLELCTSYSSSCHHHLHHP